MSGASDPDVPLSNNNIQETSEAQQIGVPLKNFNIHQSVFFTHGYFNLAVLAHVLKFLLQSRTIPAPGHKFLLQSSVGLILAPLFS